MPADWWESFETWLTAHDLTIDLITVWSLAVGFWALAIVNIITVLALRRQHDRTGVGKALKGKKSAEAAMCAAMGTLYGLTLWGYYQEVQFGPAATFGVRLIVAMGIIVAAIFGVRFVLALHGENWGQSDREIEQDAP